MIYDYTKLLSSQRERNSTAPKNSDVEEFYSDRSRIIYSSSFRRLQQKAQVFPLEPNSSVRTRLTHSIEVSDLGRTLANKIGYGLLGKKILPHENLIPLMVAVVENACLLHDIGNPPFGHFCESAVQEWAESELNGLAEKAGVLPSSTDEQALYRLLTSDFLEFDGNPQGFRIVARLHCEQDEYSLNLTYATLLCGLKYTRAAGEEKGKGAMKKAGYFQSEKDLAEKIFRAAGIGPGCRYPLTYIMEAADDIAYSLSDISDGIEKGILKLSDFQEHFERQWNESYGDELCPVKIPRPFRHFNLDLAVKWSRKIIEAAVENYLENHEAFYRGEAETLIDGNHMGKVLGTIKKVSRKLVYHSAEAENSELTGYAVIMGMLGYFGRILAIPYKKFRTLLEDRPGKGLELEWRLYSRLGRRHIKNYRMETERLEKRSDSSFPLREWWLRVHLILDHLSGMTDGYALSTYQILTGIRPGGF